MSDEKKPQNSNGQRQESDTKKPTISPPRPTDKPGYMIIKEMTDKRREAEKKADAGR